MRGLNPFLGGYSKAVLARSADMVLREHCGYVFTPSNSRLNRTDRNSTHLHAS